MVSRLAHLLFVPSGVELGYALTETDSGTIQLPVKADLTLSTQLLAASKSKPIPAAL